MADGGYAPSPNILVPYRNPQGEEELEFNAKLSSARIIVEHVMRLLKGRRCSLRGLRVQLQKQEDMEKINRWILACLILHNMVKAFVKMVKQSYILVLPKEILGNVGENISRMLKTAIPDPGSEKETFWSCNVYKAEKTIKKMTPAQKRWLARMAAKRYYNRKKR
ncbi:hypothetical protein HDV01_001740 [Terramyces sp. JEL0728]|nr:hypothetical protein HDV01_001740 [Terramyces sp. JEL0728]